MSTAWEEGVTLFDTARSYGYGEAEAVLGEFLQGKRDQAVVATKFGIAPQTLSGFKRLMVPTARLALQVPGVNRLRRQDSRREAKRGHFTVAQLRTSLETSLRELRTDRVDVLFLHEATARALHQDDLAAELGDLMQAGKVLRVGLYAEKSVIDEAMTDPASIMGAVQFGADPFDPLVGNVPVSNKDKLLLIANHPFGGSQRMARMKMVFAAMASNSLTPVELQNKLREGNWQMMLEAIFGMTLENLGIHALVLSMMQPGHIRANVRAVEAGQFTKAELAWMRQRMLSPSAAEPRAS